MALPVSGPTTLALVKAQLRIVDTVDDTGITAVVEAVNDLVRGLPVAQAADGETTWDAFDNIVLGATMLSARLWRRRDSPAGVITFGTEGSAYVSRNDPDVAQLLRIGAYTRPAIG